MPDGVQAAAPTLGPAIALGVPTPTLFQNGGIDPYFAHSFGHSRRVLGFGGALIDRGGQLQLEQFVLCCTGQLPASELTPFHLVLSQRLRAAGWSLESGAPQPSWRVGDAGVTWLDAKSDSGQPLIHIVLTYGSPCEAVYRRVFGHVSHHTRHLGIGLEADSIEKTATDWSPERVLTLVELAARISGRRVVAYTGAGISAASGIPTFDGDASLNNAIPLMEDFPGDVLNWIVERPAALVSELGTFQARLWGAEPNAAHWALAHLERMGYLAAVVTNNFDRLHEQAGTRYVRRPHRTRKLIPDGVKVEVLLVIGVSDDEHGFVQDLRLEGAEIIVISPDTPRFLRPGDALVRGRAEDVLPQITDHVSRRLTRLHEAPPLLSAEAFERLVRRVHSQATTMGSSIHGDRHWRRVAWLGAHLAAAVPGCDPWIVLLFSLLHDSQREGDGHDPQHGERAATLALQVSEEIGLERSRRDLLESGCFAHADGDVSHDPTVGVCWDADRLDLWRCGLTPDPHYLSTIAALNPARIKWSGDTVSDEPWGELWRRYTDIANGRS
jgi:uncharacterized protein